jgi:transcriptional regulator with XRE-family HTH domain
MNQKYSNVSDMLDGIGLDSETKELYKNAARQSRLSRMLFALRCKADMTQTEMAERLGCRQSVISRIENSTDAKLSLEDLLRYAKALDMQLNIGFCDKKATFVEQLKYHLQCLDKTIKGLLELADDDLSILAGAAGVFEGAAKQFTRTLTESAEHIQAIFDQQTVALDEGDRLHLSSDVDPGKECCKDTASIKT